ncbi:MAG: hypothetical protein RR827_06595 [Oscillospiraceae bacterium]
MKYTAAFQDACETGSAPQREAAFYWISSNKDTVAEDYGIVKNDFSLILRDIGWALNEINENLSEDDVNFHEVVLELQKIYKSDYAKK